MYSNQGIPVERQLHVAENLPSLALEGSFCGPEAAADAGVSEVSYYNDRARVILASTLASVPESRKIIKNKSHLATFACRTL